MKNRAIQKDDLKPGMFVIVEEWMDETLAPAPEGDERPYWMRNPNTRKPVGDPMKVLAVALPFFTVELCGKDKARGVLDTRHIKLQEVGLDYVRSLIPNYGKKPKAPKPTGPTKQSWDPKPQVWKTIPDSSHD